MTELKKEQREAVFHNDGNLLVSASAGSGKTFVMIERLIRLVSEKKASVNQILAVTFTEAAAAEMKEKLKKALVKKINEGETALAEELTEVASADVCTLHSFCAALLRRYFFAADVSPDFKIADEDDAGELKKESADEIFRELYEKKDEDFLNLTARYRKKRSDKTLKENILSVLNFADSEADPEEFLRRSYALCEKDGFYKTLAEYKKYLDKDALSALSDAEDAQYLFKNAGNEKGAKFAELLINEISRAKSGDIYAYAAAENVEVKAYFGTKLSVEEQKAKELVVSARDAFYKGVVKRAAKHLADEKTDAERSEKSARHVRALVETALAVRERYAEKKREENLLDFSDLEHFVLKALRDERVKKAVREKYKYVFVDEYQDVNGVQESIISAVSDNNLFMVGDVKQSIYGFRGCRPEIFGGKLEAMKARGEKTVLLNHNFRSAAEVINAVNAIFSYSMTKESSGTDYAGDSMLISGGVFPEEETGRAELHLLINEKKRRTEKEEPRVYDIEKDASSSEKEDSPLISALVTEIIRKELKREFYDVKEGKSRKIGYSDIAILTRNKSNSYVTGLVTGLIRRGIPVASEVKENVCDYQETATLINVLKLVDCFYSDVPLISALLSPIGGFTEEELAEISIFYSDETEKDGRKNGFTGAFLYFAEHGGAGALKSKVCAFIEYIDKLRFLSDFLGAGGTLEKIIEDCGYENYLLASDSGEEKVKRLHGFVAAATYGGKNYTVKEFIGKTENAEEIFKVPSGGEENAVRVMTIHASKGLEFPVCIVCGLERRANNEEEREEILTDRTLGLATRCFDDEKRVVYETPLRGLFRERMRENRVKEELRLFYVAATRAQYSLHLTFEGKEDKRREEFRGADKFLDYIPKSLPVTEWKEEDFVYTDLTAKRRKVLVGKADETLTEEMKKAFSYRYPFASATELPLKSTVTEIAERSFSFGTEKSTEKSTDKFTEKRVYLGETDDKKGVLAHRILELYDFGNPDFAGQVKIAAEKGLLDEEALETVDLSRIERAAKCETLKKLSGYTLYREQPFTVNVPAKMIFDTDSEESVLLQGVIDLLAIKDGKAVIADYKYSEKGRETLKARYKKQLDLYAYATEKVLGLKVEKKILVNVFEGYEIEF